MMSVQRLWGVYSPPGAPPTLLSLMELCMCGCKGRETRRRLFVRACSDARGQKVWGVAQGPRAYAARLGETWGGGCGSGCSFSLSVRARVESHMGAQYWWGGVQAATLLRTATA